jgi:hypothetical protein
MTIDTTLTLTALMGALLLIAWLVREVVVCG